MIPVKAEQFVLLTALSVLTVAPQAPVRKKGIPSITREVVKAVVLVVASDKTGKEIRQGSGFVVSEDGKVITNYHVIERARSVVIKFPNGAFYYRFSNFESLLRASDTKLAPRFCRRTAGMRCK